jgi:hypothetical protein
MKPKQKIRFKGKPFVNKRNNQISMTIPRKKIKKLFKKIPDEFDIELEW